MSRIYLPLILFLLLVLQGVAFDLLPNVLVSGQTIIISHWVFIILIFITTFYDDNRSYYAIIYSIIFGLLIDIVYTNVLGIYMFTYTLIIYLIHTMKKMITINFYSTMLLGVVGIVFVDFLIYVIYSVVGFAHMTFGEYVFNRLLPTTLANIIFLIICYPIVKNRFLKWHHDYLSKSSSF